MFTVTVALADDELRNVQDEPREVTDEEHDHDADQDGRQVHFIVGRTISVGSNMSVSTR